MQPQFRNLMPIPFWSTLFLPPDIPLGRLNKQLRAFSNVVGKPEPGGRVLSLSDTNMRSSGSLDTEYNVSSVSWFIQPCVPVGDMEALAQSQQLFDDALDVAAIRGHGVLSWDFTQTAIHIGPLWLDALPQRQLLPVHSTFAINVAFDEAAPALRREYALRICLQGEMRLEWGL